MVLEELVTLKYYAGSMAQVKDTDLVDIAKDLASPDSLPQGWSVYLDKTSKRRFYNNRVHISLPFEDYSPHLCRVLSSVNGAGLDIREISLDCTHASP